MPTLPVWAKEYGRADFRQKRDQVPCAGLLDSICWTRSRVWPHYSGSFSVAQPALDPFPRFRSKRRRVHLSQSAPNATQHVAVWHCSATQPRGWVGQAEAPEYRFRPAFQNARDPTNNAAANAMEPASRSASKRPTRACDGTVTANATGTRKVSAAFSQPG